MFAGWDIAQGEKPDHEGVGERKLASADIGENPKDGVFAGAGVNVDAITGEPGENLGLGVHFNK